MHLQILPLGERVMGWFSNIFGSAEKATAIVDKAADGIYNGVDKMFYTEEEKADATRQGWAMYLEFIKMAYFDQNSIRSITRRWIAAAIVATTLLSFFISLGFALAGRADVVDIVIALAEAYKIGWAFVTVIVFYFGVQFLRTGNNKKAP